jgi:hypothetical protein
MILAILIIGTFAFYVMNANERTRALQPVRTFLQWAIWAGAHGLVAARWYFLAVRARKPWAVTTLSTAGVLMIILFVQAVTFRPPTDVKPEIARVIEAEDRTARTYESAVSQFKLGTISADALVQVINQTVVPELRAVHKRLTALEGVAEEHQSLVTRAEEYLRLRSESWRLRAEALQKRNLTALKKADRAERASLEVFERVRQAL